MKILIADDSKTTLNLLSKSLQELGHEVLMANSGREALDLFQRKNPDLIILDVLMQDIDGFETAKKIRASNQEDWVPIIFLSGVIDDESIAKGIDAGGDDYLTKPFSEITLSAKIKAMQRLSCMRQELFEATQQLARLSSIDALTGCYNRLQFDKIIKEKIAEASRQHRSFALLYVDLDHFKTINDSLGHPMGDRVLVQAVERLKSNLRINDFLARMGGDEFAIILSPIENKETLSLISQKLIDTLASPYTLNEQKMYSSASIGIVLYPVDGKNQEQLCKNADLALYQAKNLGRNQYQLFSDLTLKSTKLLKEEDKQDQSVPYVGFKMGQESWGIPFQYVKEVVPHQKACKVPNTAPWIVGVINRQGGLLTLLDLKIFLERQINEALDPAYLIILQIKEKMIAVLADSIEGSALYLAKDLALPQKTTKSNYIKGLYQGEIHILDVDALLESTELHLG